MQVVVLWWMGQLVIMIVRSLLVLEVRLLLSDQTYLKVWIGSQKCAGSGL